MIDPTRYEILRDTLPTRFDDGKMIGIETTGIQTTATQRHPFVAGHRLFEGVAPIGVSRATVSVRQRQPSITAVTSGAAEEFRVLRLDRDDGAGEGR